MASIFISYGYRDSEHPGYEFHTTGRPHYTRTVRYETDAPGTTPRREIVTYGINQIFREHTFGDNQAKYWEMLKAIKAAPEGRLLIRDEFGNELHDVLAKPETSSLPDQWGQWMTEVALTFTSMEIISDGAAATIENLTTGETVRLKNVSSWRNSVRTERGSFAVNNRRETTGTVSASGKIVANPKLEEADRRTELQEAKTAIMGVSDGKESQLVFGAFDRTVRVESVEADIKDGSYELEWAVTATYRRFPDGDYTEAEYTVATRDDLERGERVITVAGKVRASTIEEARARVASINDSYRATGRSKRRTDRTETLVDGTDGAANYNEIAFSTEFHEQLAAINWTLTISSKKDTRTGQITTTYSGKVTGGTAGTALDQARRLGLAVAPGILMTSTESIQSLRIGSDEVQVIEVDFSYEYVGKGNWTFAEVTSETNTETFGPSTTVVSGSCTALTEVAAGILARTFRPASGLRLSQRESFQKIVKADSGAGEAALFVRCDFNYTFRKAPENGALEYAIQTSKDFQTRETTTTWNGTAYGPDEATAQGLINALTSGLQNLGRHLRDDRTVNRKKSEGGDQTSGDFLVSISFTLSFAAPLDAGGDDILEAESTLSITYSVNHAVITPIPFGQPHVQPNCGWTPGLKTASANCTAITLAGAKTWCRAMREQILGLGAVAGYEDPPVEKDTTSYYPLSADKARYHRFSAEYAARFAYLPYS